MVFYYIKDDQLMVSDCGYPIKNNIIRVYDYDDDYEIEIKIIYKNLEFEYKSDEQRLLLFVDNSIVFGGEIENDDMANFAQDLIKEYTKGLTIDYFNDAMRRMEKLYLFINEEFADFKKRSKLVNFNPQSKSSRHFIDQ